MVLLLDLILTKKPNNGLLNIMILCPMFLRFLVRCSLRRIVPIPNSGTYTPCSGAARTTRREDIARSTLPTASWTWYGAAASGCSMSRANCGTASGTSAGTGACFPMPCWRTRRRGTGCSGRWRRCGGGYRGVLRGFYASNTFCISSAKPGSISGSSRRSLFLNRVFVPSAL